MKAFWKKSTAMLLAVLMIVSVLPVSVFAEEIAEETPQPAEEQPAAQPQAPAYQQQYDEDEEEQAPSAILAPMQQL